MAVFLLLLMGCAQSAQEPVANIDTAEATAIVGAPVGFSLLTHCGIEFAQFDGRWFVTDRLDDGAGNPPAGWDNPSQTGTMTLISDDEAIFADVHGHRLSFKRPAHLLDQPAGCA